MDIQNEKTALINCQQEDLEVIVSSDIDFDKYRDCTVLITGATGFIGSTLAKSLLCANQRLGLNVKVVAAVRNTEKAEKVFGKLLTCRDLELLGYDVTEPIMYREDVDYIFHTACVTTSKTMVEAPVCTIETSYIGTRNVLEYAKEKCVKGVVYVSSMEVYGQPDPALERVKETDLGYIDISNVRSSYSEGKRICECLCTAYANECKVPVKIARLAQTFGAGVPENDNRVYAQFAKSIINKNDIVMHTAGMSEGNYCYIRDAVTGLLLIAYKGEVAQAYNVVNEEMHMQIREMAELVVNRISENNIKVVFDIPESALTYGYAPQVKMHLSGEKLRSLGWNPKVGMEEAYRRMIHDMKL